MAQAKEGDWVQIHRIILAPGQRAPQVPADTQQVPLELWDKGFLAQAAGEVGETVTIRTVTDRLVTGELTQVLPCYAHNFGEPQPELLPIGVELREMLWGGKRRG